MNKYQLAHATSYAPTGRSVWIRPERILAVKEVRRRPGDEGGPVTKLYLSDDVSFYVVGSAAEVMESMGVRRELSFRSDPRPDPEDEGVYEADEHGDDAEVYRVGSMTFEQYRPLHKAIVNAMVVGDSSDALAAMALVWADRILRTPQMESAFAFVRYALDERARSGNPYLALHSDIVDWVGR